MENRQIIARGQAYAGESGELRKQYCIRFTRHKQESFRRINEEIFAQVTARGETITCRKGCPVCCVAYIEANLQECEAIAWYLYEHHTVLDSFITRYGEWRRRLNQTGGPFAIAERILHINLEQKISGGEQAALLEVLKHYQEQKIPCSFLDQGACLIHEVRPYVCANHFVTTPESWCNMENWQDPASPKRPRIYMTVIDELYDTGFYQGNMVKPVIGFMPAMVYRILTEGWQYIKEATGMSTTCGTGEESGSIK